MPRRLASGAKISSVSWAMRLRLLLRQGAEGAHVVQAVGQLDQHDAHVVDHGQEHLAQALRSGVGLRSLSVLHLTQQVDLAQFGDAIYQGCNLVTELLTYLVKAELGVFHHVVQQPGHDRLAIEPQVCQALCHRQRMLDVGLARGARLPLVRTRGKRVRTRHLADVAVWNAVAQRAREGFYLEDGLLGCSCHRLYGAQPQRVTFIILPRAFAQQ